MIDYRITSRAGYAEKIGELVSMLEHTRAVTLEEIKGLSERELDFLPDDRSNTIGSLLLHIASIEYVHQVISFEKRDITEAEIEKWQAALELGETGRNSIRQHGLEFYLEKLSQVRENTLAKLKNYEDQWLFEENQWGNGVPHNNYYLWYHVMEDEINHRGQIRVIKRMLAEK
ncbi:DinB family protein [Thalassobacillus devorans]|uniref:DinB family protein n=1 Tax=Thalassobacillus devorans TaxID=279813 RepID=UPI000A1CB609|nr:DinB family protein [Thalassobacillus devorans]